MFPGGGMSGGAANQGSEQISIGRRHVRQREGASRFELKYALWDTMAGMVFAEVVAYSIILATGATLFVAGKTDIASATDAAQALRPLAGVASALLLAIGLIGAGVLAVPVLTGAAAYGVAEAFGWRSGLDRKLTRAPQFYRDDDPRVDARRARTADMTADRAGGPKDRAPTRASPRRTTLRTVMTRWRSNSTLA